MTAELTVLRPKERVHLDSEPIAAIYRDLGTSAAEGVVTRALTELAMTMAGLAERVQSHDLTDLARQLRRLSRMADHLGMVSLGHVARDVGQCLANGDSTAFSAVWARLLRIAERSLSIEGNLRDGSV